MWSGKGRLVERRAWSDRIGHVRRLRSGLRARRRTGDDEGGVHDRAREQRRRRADDREARSARPSVGQPGAGRLRRVRARRHDGDDGDRDDQPRIWEPYGERGSSPSTTTKGRPTALTFDPSRGTRRGGGARRDALSCTASAVPARRALCGSSRASSPSSGRATAYSMAAARTAACFVLPRSGRRPAARAIDAGSSLVTAAFGPTAIVLATAGTDGVVQVRGARSTSAPLALPRIAAITSVALDPSGRLVAVGAGKTIRVYDARTGAPRAVLRSHTDDVTGVAFSPNGRLLASSSKDHDARVWEARSTACWSRYCTAT